jgi:hypothetical protein
MPRKSKKRVPILHAEEGKGIDSVKAFLLKLRRAAKIEAIAADMHN